MLRERLQLQFFHPLHKLENDESGINREDIGAFFFPSLFSPLTILSVLAKEFYSFLARFLHDTQAPTPVLTVVATQLSFWLGFTPDQREFKLTKRKGKVILNLGNLQCGHMNIDTDAAK